MIHDTCSTKRSREGRRQARRQEVSRGRHGRKEGSSRNILACYGPMESTKDVIKHSHAPAHEIHHSNTHYPHNTHTHTHTHIDTRPHMHIAFRHKSLNSNHEHYTITPTYIDQLQAIQINTARRDISQHPAMDRHTDTETHRH